MTETDHPNDEVAEVPPAEPEAKPLPMVVVRGAGYITRKNGEVIHFTIEGEG